MLVTVALRYGAHMTQITWWVAGLIHALQPSSSPQIHYFKSWRSIYYAIERLCKVLYYNFFNLGILKRYASTR